MTAPIYTGDLTDIDLAEVATNYVAINYGGGGGGAPAAGIDLAMQGTNCIDRPVNSTERAIIFENGTAIADAVATGVHIFQWLFVATPGLTESIGLRGAYVVCGDDSSNTMQYHVEGNDTYGAVGRVGVCYPYRYVTTANTGQPPYRTVNGTPSAEPTAFGAGMNTTNTAKGSNLGVDAMRYGKGAYLYSGELISAGDASDNPCTFNGFATINDQIANRWGIMSLVAGSYELQGLFSIGQNNTPTGQLCRFQDADVNIVLIDTPHTLFDFTNFIIDHDDTRCYWTNVNITALGTGNPGQINVINTGAVFSVNGGTYTNIGTTSLNAQANIDGATWRLADSVTLNTAVINDCSFDRSNIDVAALITDDLNDVTSCNFIGGAGSGHAVELTAVPPYSIAWNSTFDTTTYADADGSTGDEVIYVNVTTGDLTINVAVGATTPTIRTAGTSVTVVVAPVTTTITVVDGDTNVLEGARVYVTAGSGGPLSEGTVIINTLTDVLGEAEDTRELASSQPIEGWVRFNTAPNFFKQGTITGTISNANGVSITIQLVADD